MANVTVRRANVVLNISDDEAVITKYLNNGYDVVNSAGKIVRESTHGKGEAELRKALEDFQEKYDKLKKENEDLKAKLDVLVAEDELEETPDELEEAPTEAPKKRRPKKD